MREADLHRLILRECGAGDVRLFRNNVGTGWQGRVVRRDDGLLILADPRPLHAGLCVGSGDLIGMRRIIITPDMIGRAIAQFVSLEAKTGSGRTTDAQRNWAAFVTEFGGLAGIARSVEEARAILGK